MREACLKTVYELAKRDERVMFIGSDLGVGVLDEYKKTIPDRFFMEGVAEQNLVGVAAGMAMEGHVVYLNTIATFLTRRCFEQIAVDLCLHKINVRLIANGGGCVYAPLGPTHLAIEDLSILRALPNMTIIAPADEPEMVRMMYATLDYPGPIYVRIAKGTEPKITGDPGPFVIGKARSFRDGTDALIACTGVGLHMAIAASETLAADGIECSILHFPTIKPLDTEALFQAVEKVPVVVTVEENTILGGFGSSVAEVLAESELIQGRKFKRIGIPDVFPSVYGDQNGMMRKYGISAESIVETIQTLRHSQLTPSKRQTVEAA